MIPATRFGSGHVEERTVVARQDPLLGSVLDDRFRIDFQLAAGGFGAIYRATDVMSDAQVALKVLLPQLARDQMVVARFRREGATLSKLRDPHTITAYEIGEAADGTLYIVMELLHGESLYEQFRANGPLPWRRMVHIARGVCSSLAEAHAYGVVHRDLKPANIHLEAHDDDPDFAKVIDFGIAKIVHGGEFDHRDLTQTGQMIGTLDYMSPEQMVGGELTGQSDIYTLGIVMYEMISGRMPFNDAQTATAILAAVLTQAAEPLSVHAEVPPELDRIVMCCLERERADRFADVGELDHALAQLEEPQADLTRVVPAGLYEHTLVTGATTRVDVRVSESSSPVLDVRGPRMRQPEPEPDHSAESDTTHPAIPRQSAQELRPQPAIDDDTIPTRQIPVLPASARPPAMSTPIPPPPPVIPTPPPLARPSPPMMAPAMPLHAMPSPVPMMPLAVLPPAMLPAIHPPGMPMPMPLPPSAIASRPMQGMPPGVQGTPQVMQAPMPVHPPVRPSSLALPPQQHGHASSPSRMRGYDMDAAATHDTLVRRIIWAVVVFVVLLAIVIATR